MNDMLMKRRKLILICSLIVGLLVVGKTTVFAGAETIFYSDDYFSGDSDAANVLANFVFAGEKVSRIILWTDVLDDLDEDVSPISSEKAAALAAEVIDSEYETYQGYVEGGNVETETVLNARDGKLYWDVTISNGEYGGYIAELDAFTGKCVSADQFK